MLFLSKTFFVPPCWKCVPFYWVNSSKTCKKVKKSHTELTEKHRICSACFLDIRTYSSHAQNFSTDWHVSSRIFWATNGTNWHECRAEGGGSHGIHRISPRIGTYLQVSIEPLMGTNWHECLAERGWSHTESTESTEFLHGLARIFTYFLSH